MRCRICGAKLTKEGDICKNCYEEYSNEEELKKKVETDNNYLMKIYRKYIPSYYLKQYMDYYVLGIIMICAFIAQKQILGAILSGVGVVVFICSILAIYKQKAINTICILYDDKVVLKKKDIVKAMSYKEIENVAFYQSKKQIKYNLGDIIFKPKKGFYLFNGLEIRNVPDFVETLKKATEIVDSKREEV